MYILTEILGSELVFIVYPHTIALMNWSKLWSILFFFMLITLGIDSTVSFIINFLFVVNNDNVSLDLVWRFGIDYYRPMRWISTDLWSASIIIRSRCTGHMLSWCTTNMYLRWRLYCQFDEWSISCTCTAFGRLCWMYCCLVVLW